MSTNTTEKASASLKQGGGSALTNGGGGSLAAALITGDVETSMSIGGITAGIGYVLGALSETCRQICAETENPNWFVRFVANLG